MAGTTKVLVCVDESATSEKAFKWYMDTFYNPSHQVLMCHVPEYWGDVQRMLSPARLDELIKETRANSAKLQEKMGAACQGYNVQAEFKALTGNDVWHAICAHADQEKADVIVIGTRGMGAIKRTLLGSVSDGVLHHSSIPVLIYKDPAQHKQTKQ